MSTVNREIVSVRHVGTLDDVHVSRRDGMLLWVHTTVTTTATAGNRNLIFTLYGADGNELYDIRAGANQNASLTRHYNFIRGVNRESNFGGGSTEMTLPLADIMFGAGMSIVVADENAIDSADVVTLSYQIEY